ncbi:MAG: hypothetical protein M3Y13_05265, partial [Armatimonadota bacterium]|nr:hypothetical protein [Armatimonadota bacterium]
MMSWILIDGDSAHQLFWDIEDFQKREKEDQWFTRNQRRIQLFGKSLREKPSVALLWSVRTNLLGNSLPWNWDIGRGEIESAHYDNVYVTEREMKLGLAQDYPVVFDCGTALMDPPLVAAIRKYVEAGGTFVALHNTGHYTSLEPDSYPIADLTGFKVLSSNKRGKITFGTRLPLFQQWEGRQFEGEGSSLDWKNNQTAQGVGMALSPASSDTVALAKWEDGSVAVGYRKLGKGRIILLGSTFWRSGKDVAGVWLSGSEVERNFLQTLFTDLGIARTADSDSPDVWTRKFTTKNGLQDWLIALNNAEMAQTTTLSMRVAARPDQVLDMLTNQPVPFTYSDDGWVHIPNIVMPVVQARIFGVRRGNLVSGLPVWWGEKTKYWKRIALKDSPSAPSARISGTTVSSETIAFDSWKFWPDRDGARGATDAWKQPGFADAAWQTLQRGPWNLQDASLKDYRGIGLYRKTFRVPAAWAGHRIRLGLYSFNNPIVYDKGEFFVNGKPAATYQSRGWNQTLGFDITDSLRPGINSLAVKVTGGKEFAGLSGPVWLEPERILAPSLSLNSGWQAIGGDGVPKSMASVPIHLTARNLAQRIMVPASWQGRDVYLHLETPDQWLGAIAVNGHPIVYTSFQHPFGTRTDINVSLYLRAGQPNTIELWPFSTLPHGDGIVDPKEDGIRLSAATLGCEQGKTNSLFGSMIGADDPVEPDAPLAIAAQAPEAAAPGPNITVNADFEAWTPTGLPDHWEFSNLTQDPKAPRQGTATKDMV